MKRMKTYHLLATAAFATIVLLTACRKNTASEDTTTPLIVSVTYDTTGGNFNFSKSGISITLTNLLNGNSNTLITDSTGQLKISALSAGQYNVAASITLTAAQYLIKTGIAPSGDNVVFNTSLNNITINKLSNTNISLVLKSGTVGNWLIKQVYFAGSHRTLGALYRDQFIEVYNNSTDTLYADSLYIAGAFAANTAGSTSAYFTTGAFAGQYDWQKSLFMPTNIDANNDYIYTKWMYMIPGTGKTYPVAPGKSIVIAQTAVNHKSPFTGSDGSTISVQDPSLTVDLSGADFEAYVAPFIAKPLDSDIDNPKSVNIIPIKIFGTDMILDNPGRDAFVIFKIGDTTGIRTVRSDMYFPPTVTSASSTATQYNQVAVKYIIDAVESQPSTASARVPKKLRDNLDAGFTYVPASSYSSQSVIRKTAKTLGGRKILMDTNNSTIDFTYLNIANPKGFAD